MREATHTKTTSPNDRDAAEHKHPVETQRGSTAAAKPYCRRRQRYQRHPGLPRFPLTGVSNDCPVQELLSRNLAPHWQPLPSNSVRRAHLALKHRLANLNHRFDSPVLPQRAPDRTRHRSIADRHFHCPGGSIRCGMASLGPANSRIACTTPSSVCSRASTVGG